MERKVRKVCEQVIIISPEMHWIWDDRSKIISNWPASYGVKDFNIYANVFERELFLGLLKENNAANNIIWYQNQRRTDHSSCIVLHIMTLLRVIFSQSKRPLYT